MKVCARVWISVNYLTKATRTHTHTHKSISCNILLARHSSTCLFLSVSPSPLSRSLCLISYWAPRLKITRSRQLFSASKHLSRPTWDRQFHSLLQTWPCLKYILRRGSQGGERYKKSLFSNFHDNSMEDTFGAGPMEESMLKSSSTGQVFFQITNDLRRQGPFCIAFLSIHPIFRHFPKQRLRASAPIAPNVGFDENAEHTLK